MGTDLNPGGYTPGHKLLTTHRDSLLPQQALSWRTELSLIHVYLPTPSPGTSRWEAQEGSRVSPSDLALALALRQAMLGLLNTGFWSSHAGCH